MENNAEIISLNDLLPDSIGGENEEVVNLEELSQTSIIPILDIEPVLEAPQILDKEPEKPTVVSNSSIDFKTTLKNVFGDTVSTLIIPDEEGNDQEVSIDDIEIDQETFDNIVRSSVERIREEESKDKISFKKVSDFTKSLIEIDQNGGDIRQLLEVKSAYLDPLDAIDISTIEGQREVIYLRLAASGTPEQDIKLLLKSYESEGILSEKATQSETEIRNAVAQRVQHEQKLAADAEIQRKENFKQYRKDYKDSLGQFKLSDAVKNKLTDIATKEVDKGKYELDALYSKHRNDPKLAARLALFLYNEDEYIGQVTDSTILNKQKSMAAGLRLTPKGSGSETTIKKNQDKDFIPLQDL